MAANKLEKFTLEVVNRKDIHGADYNPRRISQNAEKKLRKELKEVGMLQPIVINKRTMNIVSGHQRINAMDTILKRNDYDLTVAVVDMDDREEVKANILLNNPAVQGEWDMFKLQDLKTEFQFSLDDLGFDREDGLVLFDMSDSDPKLFHPEIENTEESEEAEAKKIETNRDHAKRMRDQKLESISDSAEDNDYSLVLVFPTAREKQRFCILTNNPKSATHIKSSILYDIYSQKYDITRIGG